MIFPKIRTDKNGNCFIRFRVAKKLQKYFHKEYIYKSLSTKNKRQSRAKASLIVNKYQEILSLSDLLDDTTITNLVGKYVSDTLKLTKVSSVSQSNSQSITFEFAVATFKKWYSKTDIQSKQYHIVSKRLDVAVCFFGRKKVVDTLTIEDVEEYIEFLSTYPNTNKKAYKSLSYEEIVNLKDIPKADQISSSTLIKYIKAFRQVENFLVDEGQLNRKISKRANLPVSDAVRTNEFTQEDIKALFEVFEQLDDRKYIYYTLAYTGMRPSEFWKCRIGVEEGIVIFDLSYEGIELKTLTSHRKIPIHSNLINMGIVERLADLQKRFRQDTISNFFNEKLLSYLQSSENKIMYSFRHTVATELKRADVEMDKISELLGHGYNQKSITKTTYANRFSLEQLQEAIGYINYLNVDFKNS